MAEIDRKFEKHDPDVELVQATTNSDRIGSIVELDDNLLRNIGYEQEFKREFTKWSTLSYAISVQGVLGSISASWAAPLAAGGTATAIWAWFTGSLFALCIAFSVAELVSAYPTAGGMYFVVKHVFPKDKVPIAAWIIGWSNFLGQTAGVASVGYSVGQMLLAAVAMGLAQEDGTLTYVPTAEHTVACSIGIMLIFGVVCSLPSKTLSQSIKYFAPINLGGSIIICIVILVLTENKPSASYVFGNFTDGSGWSSKGFSYMLGYLSVAWALTDYDATAHMAEEQQNAARNGPVAIVQSIFITFLFGWMLNITYGFCTVDMDQLLTSPFGNPAAQIFFNAAGRRGGLALWFWVVLVQCFTGMCAMLSDTRTAFALARDEMFPFSHYLRKVNNTTKTPLYSVWLVVVFCCLLNLIALGNVQTINGIFGVTAPALDLSYVAVVAGRLYYEKEMPIAKGPFNLGKFQKPVNIIACVWVCCISVILFFPPYHPVTAQNMNYAVAIAGFIFFFAVSWWYLGARKHYVGPRNEEGQL